ncbi:MAG: hypothetical protein RLY71_4506 [Pseudomonadota bacterium]|jgi:hypothetical protein
MRMPVLLIALGLTVLLSGCDQLGIESGAVTAERKEAEGRAIGSACRHAMRAIEDCYTLNPKAQKAAVFAGWREFDEYMRENKLEGIAPVVPRTPAKPASQPDSGDADTAATDKADQAPPAKRHGSGH